MADLTTWLRFLRDNTASMATQVVIFSILLFGASGMVLDFGRVYSEHSRMQAFTDQAALSAAAELDLDIDSIDRAIAAVFGPGGGAVIPKGALFSDGTSDQFRISHLFFLSDLSDDVPDAGGSRPQYDLAGDIAGPNLVYTAFANGGAAGGDIAAASTQARYVVAVAEERSVRNTLMRLINSAGSDAVRESVLRTIAAARRKRLSCGALSNLVICNPWEDDPGASFQSEMSGPGATGRQFRHVADGLTPAEGALSAPNALARRLSLEAPAAVARICADPQTMPGANPAMSEAEAATAYAICMLASAREHEFCVGDEVAFVPAPPEEIATALGTAFDLWDAPISDVLYWDRDADGDHSQAVDEAGVSLFDAGTAHVLRDQSPLFQPDLNIMKGRVRDELRTRVNAALGVPESSRLNYPRGVDYESYDLLLNPCLRTGATTNCATTSAGETIDYISNPTTHSAVAQFFIANFPLLYQRDLQTPPEDMTSFYQAYRTGREDWLHAREAFTTAPTTAVEPGQTLTLTGEDGSLDTRLGPPDENIAQIQTKPAYDENGVREDVNGDGEIDAFDVEPAYSNYTYNPVSDPIDRALERRVFDATVVNCGAARVETEAGVPARRAEVAGFVKMFLLQPPRARCPNGTENCLNRDLSSATLFSEFVGLPDMNETSYAVLVR